MSQPESGAVEMNTVSSAAQEIERRMMEAESSAEPEQDEAEQEAPNDEAEDIGDESQGEQEDSEDEEDNSEDEEEQPESDDDAKSADTFETLADFAEALEMPMDEFLASIKTTVKINGQEQEVNLADLRNGYQMEADYRRKTTELAQQRKALEEERNRYNDTIQQSLSQVNALLTNDEQELINEYNAVNWAELESLDQQEYLVQENKFRKRFEKLERAKQRAQSHVQEFQRQQTAKQQEHLRNLLRKESELLMEAIPDWNNAEIREKQAAEVKDFLVSRGFSEGEILMQTDENGNIVNPGIVDHRVIPIILDAMKYRSQEQKVDVAKKRVKQLPKVVRPGNKQTTKEIKARKRDANKDRFMKTGSRDDLITALIDRM